MPELRIKKDGDALEPRDLNLLYRDARRRRGFHGAGGVDVADADSPTNHPVISLSGRDTMFARLTGPFHMGYDWEEVTVGAGRAVATTGLTGGPMTGAPAWERRTGDTSLTAGPTVYEFTRSPHSGEWVFPHRAATVPPPQCFWFVQFLGCSGLAPAVSGITWTMKLGGVTVGSGVGGAAFVDSTGLGPGGPLTITVSGTGWTTLTRTLAATVGPCVVGGGNSIAAQITLIPDPAYYCCPTRLPGHTSFDWGCPDPLPEHLPLVTTAGTVDLYRGPMDGIWFGTLNVPGVAYSFDSYGVCFGSPSPARMSFIFSCGPGGGLSCFLYLDGFFQPLFSPYEGGYDCFGWLDAVAFSGWDPPYQCLPRYFTIDPDLYYRFHGSIGGPYTRIPGGNPAGGPATLG